MSHLKVSRLTYRYPGTETPALRDISMAVEGGRPLLVAGANGAGKSTLLAAMAGFVPHFFQGTLEGDVTLDGQSMRDTNLAEWVTQVGLVFPNPFNQISGARLTVFEEVAFGLENLGVPPADIRTRVAHMLERLGISELADRSPYAVSGGQQQRVAIAGILVLEPAVLALDEPTSQLDPAGTREVFDVVHGLAESGHTIAIATHKTEAVRAIVETALVLEDGRVALYDDADVVMRDARLPALGVAQPARLRLENAESYTEETIDLGVSIEDLRVAATVSLSVEDVSYRYDAGIEALRGVSLGVAPGEIVVLAGENGAGKTTLSKLCNGLLRPDRGRVLLEEWNTRNFSVAQLAHRAGYVFQNPADQLFKRTVRDEVAFGPQNLTFDDDRRLRAVNRALVACGLEQVAAVHPYDLLANERRWVTIASALAMETPVLLLDEPTSGFDRFDLLRLRELLLALKRAGRTIVLITHDMSFAAAVADRVVVMAGGSILAEGTPSDVLTDNELLAKAGLEAPPAVNIAREYGLPASIVTVRDLLRVMASKSKNGF